MKTINNKGIFITFEGPDASGKTTQLKLLKEYLQGRGINPLMTREPGGTPISEKIRSIILDKTNSEMLPMTEALLYAASRSQHVGEVILPALEEGRVVISDRYVDSSISYQGYGRGMGEVISEINSHATGGLMPDMTILLKTDTSKRRTRRSAEEEDRMDAQEDAFHKAVMDGYMELAKQYPERIVVIDGEQSIAEIAEKIKSLIDDMMKKRGII
jgi:dTMP kinase